MSAGISPKIPLVVSEVFGAYDLITNFEDLARQNLKMVIMTNPGERMMDINFGVGLRRYLFEQNTSATQSRIASKIERQTSIYLPFINIRSVEFNKSSHVGENPNLLTVSVKYSIPTLGVSESFSVGSSTGAF